MQSDICHGRRRANSQGISIQKSQRGSLRKNLKWLKGNWEETWNKTDVQNRNFVGVIQARKEISESMLQFWTRVSRLVAKCNIDTLEKGDIENALQVASFTNGVEDVEIVKSNWEKKMMFDELDKLIKDTQEPKQIHKQQQPVFKIKQEPIGQIRESKK